MLPTWRYLVYNIILNLCYCSLEEHNWIPRSVDDLFDFSMMNAVVTWLVDDDLAEDEL